MEQSKIIDTLETYHFTIARDEFDEYSMHMLDAPPCNYYERGTTSPPLYVSNTIKLYTLINSSNCIFQL